MDVESKETLDEVIERAKSAAALLIQTAMKDLDGWTITIPAITITLNKPQEPK